MILFGIDATIIATWMGTLMGVATWVWRVRSWFLARIADTQEGVESGANLVAELLRQATSPARRADIHAYIQFQCTEMEADHNRQTMYSLAMGCSILFIGMFLLVASRIFFIDALPWVWWLSIASYVLAIFSFAMVLFFTAQLRRLQLGWQKRAENVLRERAFRHVLDV